MSKQEWSAQYEQSTDLATAVEQASIRKHYQSNQVSVITPFAQATLTGLLLGASAGTISWASGNGNPFTTFLTVAVLTLTGAWLLLLLRWTKLVDRLETALGIDLNQDGVIGDDQPGQPEKCASVLVEFVSENGRHIQRPTIPIDPGRLRQFSAGVLEGRPVTEREWSGSGKLFSQEEFRQVREIFCQQRWFSWKNLDHHEQGVEVLAAGRAVLRVLAQMSDAPLPYSE